MWTLKIARSLVCLFVSDCFYEYKMFEHIKGKNTFQSSFFPFRCDRIKNLSQIIKRPLMNTHTHTRFYRFYDELWCVYRSCSMRCHFIWFNRALPILPCFGSCFGRKSNWLWGLWCAIFISYETSHFMCA